MADFEVNLTGLEELRRKMKLLPERVGKNAMRRALRVGAKAIKNAAAANAKQFDDAETRESITRNLAVVAGNKRRERAAGGPLMRVGVIGGARQKAGNAGSPGGDTWYWRFLEFGTSRMRAQPFLRSAASSAGPQAINDTAAAMPTEIDKELRKL